MESFLVFTTSFLHLKIVSRQIFLTFLHVESLKPVSEFPEVLHAFGISRPPLPPVRYSIPSVSQTFDIGGKP